MLLAVVIGVPLGILITRRPSLNKPVLGSANIIQTIPSLALFGFLMPMPWLGARADRLAEGPALVAELRSIRGERPPFDVAALSVPAVFGCGQRSVQRHRAAAAALHAAVPGSQLIEIAGASHGAHLTHPDAFADLVRATVSATATDTRRAAGS